MMPCMKNNPLSIEPAWIPVSRNRLFKHAGVESGKARAACTVSTRDLHKQYRSVLNHDQKAIVGKYPDRFRIQPVETCGSHPQAVDACRTMRGRATIRKNVRFASASRNTTGITCMPASRNRDVRFARARMRSDSFFSKYRIFHSKEREVIDGAICFFDPSSCSGWWKAGYEEGFFKSLNEIRGKKLFEQIYFFPFGRAHMVLLQQNPLFLLESL